MSTCLKINFKQLTKNNKENKMTFYNKNHIKNTLIDKINEKDAELEDVFVANDLRKIVHTSDKELNTLAHCVFFRMLDNGESWQYSRDDVIKLIIKEHELLMLHNSDQWNGISAI